MFESFNADFFGMCLFFGLACQLSIEVLVFGWERGSRRLNKEIWVDLLKTQKNKRRISCAFVLSFAAVWVFGFFMFPLEIAVATLICSLSWVVSLYFTYCGGAESFAER